MTNTRGAVTAVCEEFALPRIDIETAIRSEGDVRGKLVIRDYHGILRPTPASGSAAGWFSSSRC